jgi:signal transduction histidine kinase
MNAPGAATAPSPMASGPGMSVDPRHHGLFSALSREMCRPLISLHAGFDLLLAGCEGQIAPEQRDQLQTLRAQCHALIGMTRSFLDYAGPARDARTLDLVPFRLGALLAEADRQFSGPARTRGIDWSCRLDGEDGRVFTDLAGFQQVIGEVVANALAHTPDGGRITISGRIDAEEWCVDVEDDGRGIPAQALDRVFEPLIRAGAAPDVPAGSGHGMGLAVCREMIARLGGAIALHSEPGRGTTVSLRFSVCPPPPSGPA